MKLVPVRLSERLNYAELRGPARSFDLSRVLDRGRIG